MQTSFYEFQPLRLGKLAERLMNVDVMPRVEVIDDTSELFSVENKIIGKLPIFYGPISRLPRVFRGEWSYEKGAYYWKGDPSKNTLTSLKNFFGLNYTMLGHIFIPGAQALRLFGGKILTSHALSRDIAFNIHNLIISQILAQELIEVINNQLNQDQS